MTLAWAISRELAQENGGSARGWLSAGLVLAWKQWRAEEALMAELEIELADTHQELDEDHWNALVRGEEAQTFNVVKAWVKPWYRIHKDRAWKTIKFDEYQLEVLFRGKSVKVDYKVAETDGLLSAVEKAGKEAVGEMKELLRELWLVVKPYRDATMKKEQAAVVEKTVERVKEQFTYKDTVKGIMYAVTFRGQTVYIVKNVVLKHGWKKAIEHAANQSTSEQYKELLRGLWKAV